MGYSAGSITARLGNDSPGSTDVLSDTLAFIDLSKP